MQKITIHTDGGARQNPGPAGIGVVIENESGEVIKEISEYIGSQTNNYAEYEALIAGLEWIKNTYDTDAKETTVVVFMDSELVVCQCEGRYKIKEPTLKEQFARVAKLIPAFSMVTFTHVRREHNAHADKLVNAAVDAHLKRA